MAPADKQAPLAVRIFYDALHADCFSYSIDWGDGGPAQSSEKNINSGEGCSNTRRTMTFTHAYASPGTYRISMKSNNNHLFAPLNMIRFNEFAVITVPPQDAPEAPVAHKSVEIGPAPAPVEAQKPDTGCGLSGKTWPKDMVVYAVAGDSGVQRRLGWQIDQSGLAASQKDVFVDSIRPVALILGSGEPTIWNISLAKRTVLMAVVASGHYRQALAGLPEDTPVMTTSLLNKNPCGYFSFERYPGPVDEAQSFSRKVFGRPIEAAYEADVLTVAIGSKKNAYRLGESSASRRTVESFKDDSAPLAGAMGIDQSVKEGALRAASELDLKDMPGPLRARIAGSHLKAYVLLKELVLPPGLHGESAAVFVLGHGVPSPKGALGDSALFNPADGSCLGRCS